MFSLWVGQVNGPSFPRKSQPFQMVTVLMASTEWVWILWKDVDGLIPSSNWRWESARIETLHIFITIIKKKGKKRKEKNPFTNYFFGGLSFSKRNRERFYPLNIFFRIVISVDITHSFYNINFPWLYHDIDYIDASNSLGKMFTSLL